MEANHLSYHDYPDDFYHGMPPRSRLNHLEPVGVGTPWVESLTSYIGRLASSHALYVGALVTHEVLPLFGRAYLQREAKVEGTFWRKAVAFNGTGSWAKDCVDALESLTRRTNLCYLTMLTWRKVVSHRGLLRRMRAWCPVCLEQWRVAGETVYEPLLWTLEAVTVCPRHGRRLTVGCPYCGVSTSLLAPRYRPGRCSRCERWLGERHSEGEKAEEGSGKGDKYTHDGRSVASQEGHTRQGQDEWVCYSVGELLRSAPKLAQLGVSLPADSVAKSMAAYLTKFGDGDLRELARYIGLSRRSVQAVLDGEQVPQLATMLQLCHRLGTTPCNFLTNGILGADGHSDSESYQPYNKIDLTKSRRHPRAFDRNGIMANLKEVLHGNEHPPPSMREVGRRLDYDASHLYRQFPELCQAISARYKCYRKRMRVERVVRLRSEIKEAARYLYWQNQYPTHKLVKCQLNKPRIMYEPQALHAWHETLQELGLEGE